MSSNPSYQLPQDKRSALFAVATEEFATFGFERASLNRIIGRVGMSKSSFYHFFENKTDLFRQVLEQALGPITAVRQTLRVDRLTRESFWPTMREMTRGMTELTNQTPELVMVGRMFYRSYDNPSEQELTGAVIAEASAWLVEIISRGQALGLVRADLPEDFLINMLMALGMAMDRWVIGHWEELSDGERLALGEKSFDLFARILHPAPELPPAPKMA